MMDRNIPERRGRGKYALVRLRGIDGSEEGWQLLLRLDELGLLDWGCVGEPDEFFVVKLCDQFSPGAIKGYADAVMEASRKEADPVKAKDLAVWGTQVQSMGSRAGDLNPYCKMPD